MKKMSILFGKIKKRQGFTLVELLLVISILAILAIVALAALNPVEQINRSRDAASLSDAKELQMAAERFYVNKGFYPWFASQSVPAITTSARNTANTFLVANNGTILAVKSLTGCDVLTRLAIGNTVVGCEGTNELKESFVKKVAQLKGQAGYYLYHYGRDNENAIPYFCFIPKSSKFKNEAKARCQDASGLGLPSDLQAGATNICGDFGKANGGTNLKYCLP